MQPREFKDEVFRQFARMGAAFGHAKRVEIIDVLAQGERNVESLAAQVSSTVANTSRHLQILANAGLVTRRVEGTARVYRLADDGVARTYRTLVGLAEDHLAEVRSLAEAFFSAADGVQPITFDQLGALDGERGVVLVDVRPESEFRAGHVDGAINIPVADLAARMAELPDDASIVAYCRGPYCVMASTAVTRLREAGYDAVRLAGGHQEWIDEGVGWVASSPPGLQSSSPGLQKEF